MTLKIERGVRRSAVRTTVYGPEGIGKSTLAAQWPNPVILDTEDGTGQIDCARVVCRDAMAVESALLDLAGDAQGFQTVVIDSADWLERLLLEHMLRKDNKKSVEDYGFGKGFVRLSEAFARIMGLCDQLIARGIHVVMVAHATIKRTSPPEETDGYDRYELKLTKQTAPLLKEWSDLLLFLNYKTRLVEGSDGRMKAMGGKVRVMHSERAAAWDAKNRFGLPAEMPMEIGQLEALLALPAPAGKPKSWRERIAAAAGSEELQTIRGQIEAARAGKKLTDEQAETLFGLVADRADALADSIAESMEVANG